MSGLWRSVQRALSEATGADPGELRPRSVGGGCINQAFLATAATGESYFVKLNRSNLLPMFEAEAEALQEMAGTQTIRVPKPIACGSEGSEAFLVLEAISMQSRGDSFAMGQQLAALHRTSSSNGQFGWHRDNVIGETPQPNTWTADWQDFWMEHRLGYQMQLARRKGLRLPETEEMRVLIPALFSGYEPVPSLVHGDLWGGNASFDEEGAPVLFDPATYYGDREVDLAFTHMFGGFSGDFYRGYQEAWPMAKGFEQRCRWYNLYHELNHYNLFSGGYGSQAQGTIEWLIHKLT